MIANAGAKWDRLILRTASKDNDGVRTAITEYDWAAGRKGRSPDLGWRSHTSGKVDLLQARLIGAASLRPTIVENVQEPHRVPIGARS